MRGEGAEAREVGGRESQPQTFGMGRASVAWEVGGRESRPQTFGMGWARGAVTRELASWESRGLTFWMKGSSSRD